MTHWANDSGTVFVLGRTQTGKTTATRELAKESSRVTIWLNRRGPERIRQVPGERYESLRGIKKGMARNERKFNLLSGHPRSDIVGLQSWLWDVAERTDRELPITVVVDELHDVAPQSQKDEFPARDSVRKLAKEGQKRNIKLVGITQDPVSMDKQTIRQREYLLVFDLSAEQGRYLSDYGVSVEEVNSQPEFSGVLYHASGEVIARGVKGQAKYAI